MRSQHHAHDCNAKRKIAGIPREAEGEAGKAKRNQPAEVTKGDSEEDEGVVGNKRMCLFKPSAEEPALPIGE